MANVNMYDKNTERYQKDLRDVLLTPATAADAEKKLAKKPYDKRYEQSNFGIETTYKFEKTLGNRNALVKSVMKMAFDIARRVAYRTGARAELNDIIQAANMGAIRAADEYLATPVQSEYKKKLAKFSTYAYPWITKYAREGAAEMEALMTSPINKRHEQTGLFRSGDDLAWDGDKETTVFNTGKLKQMHETMVAAAEFEDLKKAAKSLFSRLSSVNRNVLFMSFGIGFDDPMTVREISAHLGIAMGSVTKFKNDALNQLRQMNIDPELVQVLAHMEGVDLSGFQKWTDSK